MKKISFFPAELKGPDRVMHLILWLLRFDIALAIFVSLALGAWEPFFMSILALILSFIPEVFQNTYKINLPIGFNIVIVAFIYMSIFLGEIFNIYERVFWWDAFLHIGSGVILSFAAFLVLFILFKEKKFTASPFIIAVFTFSFAMMLGAMWEIFEYTMDQLFGLNMQKSGLNDTMWDMIVNAIGAFGVSWAGYRVIKYGDEKGLIYHALEEFFEHNPQLAKQPWYRWRGR